MPGVFNIRHGQAKLHAVGQFMHRGCPRRSAELVFHAQVFTGHRQQRLDPLTLGVAVHRLGDGVVEGHRHLLALAPGRQLFGNLCFQCFRRLALGHAQVDRQFERLVVQPHKRQRSGQRPHKVIGKTDPQLATLVVQAPVVGRIVRSVGNVVVLEGNLAVNAADKIKHPRHRVDPRLGLRGMSRNPGHGQHYILAHHLGIDLEIAAIALGIFSPGLVQAGRQFSRLGGDQGGDRGRRDLVGGHAAGQRDDFCALAFAFASGKSSHDGAVAFLGDHHRVTAIQRQVVIGHRVVFEVIRDGITAGFFGGVDQQLEVPGQWQLFFLDDFHGVHRHHDAVLVILCTAPVHAVADQRDLERIELGAVLEYPIFRGYRHDVGVGVNTDHFIATAFEGDFIDAVVDIAKVQVEGLGEVLDLVGDLEELRVLVLGHVIQVYRRDGYQFAQGFSG